MTQVKSAQEKRAQFAFRPSDDARSLAARRADFAAQMRAMALSDLQAVSRRLKNLHRDLEQQTGRRWTHYELAEAMGIRPRTFQSWENGEVENRDGKGYDKMARFYSRKLGRKITRRWIVFGDDVATPSENADDPTQEILRIVTQLGEAVDALASDVQELKQRLPASGEASADS